MLVKFRWGHPCGTQNIGEVGKICHCRPVSLLYREMVQDIGIARNLNDTARIIKEWLKQTEDFFSKVTVIHTCRLPLDCPPAIIRIFMTDTRRVKGCILLGQLLQVDLIQSVSNVRPYVRPSVRPSVHKTFQLNLVCRWRSTSDAWRYAVWPDPRSRSRSRALESRKFDHFQRLSPPPFIMGAGKWPRILKLGGNT